MWLDENTNIVGHEYVIHCNMRDLQTSCLRNRSDGRVGCG